MILVIMIVVAHGADGVEREVLRKGTPFVPFVGERMRIAPEPDLFVVERVEWQFDRSSPHFVPRSVTLHVAVVR